MRLALREDAHRSAQGKARLRAGDCHFRRIEFGAATAPPVRVPIEEHGGEQRNSTEPECDP